MYDFILISKTLGALCSQVGELLTVEIYDGQNLCGLDSRQAIRKFYPSRSVFF